MLKKISINYSKYFQKYFSTTEKQIVNSKQTKAILSVSSRATSRIITMFSSLDKPYPIGIRISINKRGCNGLNYIMKYIIDNDEERKLVSKDEIINITDKINIYVDPCAAFAIVGTVMDWKENELTSEFTFINPNTKGFCGCGESFNL
jgi:iron-sulfur cluster assembly accessory protein